MAASGHPSGRVPGPAPWGSSSSCLRTFIATGSMPTGTVTWISGPLPDALASAANQLKEKGWRTGIRWGHEVRAPRGLDCTIAHPDFKLPVREWLARGFVPAKGPIAPSDLAEEASLILPA